MSTLRVNSIDNLSGTGGSPNQVFYRNGSNVITGSSNLVFDGSNLVVGATGGNIIKARNTAKFWLQCSSYTGIFNSYGVASIVDQGSSQVQVNYTTPAVNSSYAIAISWHHYGSVTWQQIANYPGTPQPSYFTLRFHYGASGTNGNPTGGWGAIGFGDQ